MKKIISSIIAFALLISSITPVLANDNSYLEEFKQNYRETSVYQYCPNDMEIFAELDDNEVLDVFLGIKVCKRLLDHNLMLDIDKVTLNDLVSYEESTNSNNHTFALVPSDPGTGGYTTASVPSGYHNVYVTTRKTGISSSTLGIEDYELTMYLSHLSLTDYLVDCHVEPTREVLKKMIASYVASKFVAYVGGTVKGEIFDAAMLLSELGEYIMNQEFFAAARDIYYEEGKAIVKITNSSRSITRWTTNTYKYYNGTSSFYVFESEVEAYKDRK